VSFDLEADNFESAYARLLLAEARECVRDSMELLREALNVTGIADPDYATKQDVELWHEVFDKYRSVFEDYGMVLKGKGDP